MKYDYIIVGAGPTGLTLALYLSKKYKVAIIEREEYIGGCHGVKRIDGLFTEHGPRIYINNYLMFKKILGEINTDFNELFTPYKFGKSDAFDKAIKNLSIKEMITLIYAFFNLNDNYKKISLLEFMESHNFSDKSKDLLDRFGRLTDGGGADQYTLHSFLQIVNQNFLYTVYQPRKPNDVGLFKLWQDELLKRNVDIYLNTPITQILASHDLVHAVKSNEKIFMTDNLILALPLVSIDTILKQSNLETVFTNNFSDFSKKTEYLTYIPIIFHWKDKLELKDNWGFPETDWGVGHIILSDYTDFEDNRSKTVITSLITKYDKSTYLNKTPNEISDENIIINEVIRQLRTIYPNLPNPDFAIMSQNYYYNNKWQPLHSAFMTTKYGYIPYTSTKYKNLYNCGVHNGKSGYYFTSLESAVSNAIVLINILTNDNIKIETPTTIRQVIFYLLLVFIFAIIIYKSSKNSKP